MDIERAKGELTDFYYRQLEQGFPPGSMVKIRNLAMLLARAGEVEYDALMLDIRRIATVRLSLSRRLSQRRA